MTVTFITLILASIFSTVLQLHLLQDTILDQKILRASTLVRAVQRDIQEDDKHNSHSLQAIINNFSKESDVDRLFIVDKNYFVIKHNNKAKMGHYYKNVDIINAVTGRRTVWGIESHFEGAKLVKRLDIAMPLFIKGRLIGGLEAELTVVDLTEAANSALIRTIGLGFVSLILIFALLTWLLSYLILKPLDLITKGAEEVASGNLDHRIGLKSGDELEQVANAFDNMVGSLKKKQDALEKLAVTDSLTGLLNHRFFYERLDEEMEQARRYRHPLSICMVDVDYFKDFNDTFGHLEGDMALLMIAKILEKTVRNGDLVGRLGGEEFGIILREQGVEKSLEVAERLRKNIESHRFISENGRKCSLSVSIGIASFPEDAATGSLLAVAADKGLYKAKRSGRNCIRRFKTILSPKA